ncbi:MAG: glycoside hydrolase family 127 protein [Gemmatimonadetes bacterium]|nr:glycoside hydrolase family 127 protein [Gemmatimonadota bacterium]
MSTSRRDFLQRSAAAAAAATLAPKNALAAGDNATPAGAAPESPAAIRAFERKMLRARPLPLGNVSVTGGPLKNAQDLTGTYLLSLDPDRMMAYYRVRAGLKLKAEPYDGWDGDGKNLTGHIAGHHLSAVSIFYRVTGDARFKQRVDYLVREMKEVQDKNGDGYLSALEHGRERWAQVSKGDIRSAPFDLNGLWSPWYTLHKTFAGLRDAHRHTGNATALTVETKFAKWAEGVLAPLSDDQVAAMLNTEHGGMNEVLADLYADTGDARWLALSNRFEHHAFTDPLKRHQDNLSGKHGNCQIPKLIGSAQRYGYTADAADLVAASFFWDRVAQHHSYVTGGHGLAEYFGPPDQLSARVDGRTCETCNCYNMLKLTRRLFSLKPDAAYADFHERTLFNHILASIDDTDGRTSYMVPVGRGVEQEYQDMQHSFTCCVGTGMESHGLHGYGVYYESDDTIYVTQFVPSVAHCAEHPVSLEMTTGFPDGGSATITVKPAAPKSFTLAVRRPHWAGDGFVIKVNGTVLPQPPVASLLDAGAGGRKGAPGNQATASSTFVRITRTWKAGDVVELTLPKTVHLEATPDNKQVAAVMWGPLALAADLGPRAEGRAAAQQAPVIPPMLIAADKPADMWVIPAGTRAGDFVAKQVGAQPSSPAARTDVTLTPFHRTHRRRYSIYHDVVNEQEFASRVANWSAEQERLKRLDAATVSSVAPGDRQAEANCNYKSEPADRRVEREGRHASRGGPGWFSYDLMVEPTSEMALVVTYYNELGLPPTNGNFEIKVEGTTVAKFEPNATATGFYDARYAIPAALVGGKARVNVRFDAGEKGRIVPVFGVRIVRAKDLS